MIEMWATFCYNIYNGEKDMKCCYCGDEENKVTDSRYIEEQNAIRRRRECLGCGRRFTTYEQIEKMPLLVIKKNGDREPFRLEKIKLGMIKACEKRPISIETIERVSTEIEKKIMATDQTEIDSKRVGEFVMEALKELDQVAYVRFASVYKQFEDFTTFQDFVQKLSQSNKK